MRATAGALAILGLAVIAAAPTPTPTNAPTPTAVQVPWIVNCEDDIKANGYLFEGYCVPGEITYEASRFAQPRYFGGAMSSYAEGVMEKVAANRGMGLGGYEGGVALMGCGDIGKSAYIRRPGHDWDGPFLVVDCSGRSGLYEYILIRRLAVEVDFQTAKRYGAFTLPWVDVRVDGNVGGVPGMSLATWFERYVLAFTWKPSLPGPPTATLTPVPPTATATPVPPTATPEPTLAPLTIEAPVQEAPLFAEILFWLLVGHAVADFALQSDRMSMLKRPTVTPVSGGPWWFWMGAHALIHGGAVALATGQPALGLGEFGVHFIIDMIPGRNAYIDQGLHVGSKILWAYLASQSGGTLV
jgi:hypothetical protein